MNLIETILFLATTIIGQWAYWIYFQHTLNGTRQAYFQPNRWSWMIWSFSTLIETITYDGISDDIFKTLIFYVSSGSCVLITLAIWGKSIWSLPNIYEVFSVLFSSVAIVVWIVWDSAVWANYIAITALPIAFLPTCLDTWNDYRKEDIPSWKLWTIADTCMIVLVLSRIQKHEEIPYTVVETICHGAVWLIVLHKKYRHKS